MSFFFRDYVRYPFLGSGGRVIAPRDGMGQGLLGLCFWRLAICRYSKENVIAQLLIKPNRKHITKRH